MNIVKGVPEVIKELSDSLAETEKGGRNYKAFVTLVVDDRDGWAGICSGIELPDLMQLLQHARDDAVLGGKGFAVVVPQLSEAANS